MDTIYHFEVKKRATKRRFRGNRGHLEIPADSLEDAKEKANKETQKTYGDEFFCEYGYKRKQK